MNWVLGAFVLVFCILLLLSITYPTHKVHDSIELYSLKDYFKLMQNVHEHFSKEYDDVYDVVKLDNHMLRVVVQNKQRMTISIYDVTYHIPTMSVTNVTPSVLTPSIKSDMHMLIKKSPIFL